MAAKYESAIPYIQKAEGGLSRATTDTASKNPSPYVHNGVKGWHTNRGITWTTFKELAPKAGYEVNQKNFINMPDSVWLSVYKIGFWDAMQGSLYSSQAIANTIVDFAWAAGVGGASGALSRYLSKKGYSVKTPTQIANAFNELVKKEGEQKTFLDLIEERKRFFVSLNQPANTKGWLSRMETLKKEGLKLVTGVKTKAKESPLLTIAATATIVVGLYLIYKLIKKE